MKPPLESWQIIFSLNDPVRTSFDLNPKQEWT